MYIFAWWSLLGWFLRTRKCVKWVILKVVERSLPACTYYISIYFLAPCMHQTGWNWMECSCFLLFLWTIVCKLVDYIDIMIMIMRSLIEQVMRRSCNEDGNNTYACSLFLLCWNNQIFIYHVVTSLLINTYFYAWLKQAD